MASRTNMETEPDCVPDLSSDDENSEDEEWKEMDLEETREQCLFCSEIFENLTLAIDHCKMEHSFDLTTLKTKHCMDFYSYIKLIGYIRTVKPDSISIMTALKPLWNNDKYLKPVKQEGWLMYDFDSLNDLPKPTSSFHANVENGLVTLSEAHFAELQKTVQSLSIQVKEKNNLLNLAMKDIESMKKSMQRVLLDDRSDDSSPVSKKACVGALDLEEDSGYFNTYAHFSIHHDMLSDKVRTESYRSAILNNKDLIKDKVVLDLGCGTGILSMFAASVDAAKVIAIDQSDVIYHAIDIIRENNLHEKVVIIKGRLEDSKLPEKADIIISEWMGYFLLFEGMLDSVIFARENYLKPNGLLFPNKCNISLVGSGDMETHQKLISFWSDVYGFKMNCMKSEVVREASVEVVDPLHLITSAGVICDIDMHTCTIDSVNFTSEFSLDVLRDGNLTYLVGYFDIFFELTNPVSFSTGPRSTPTHWKQTIFYFKDPIPLKKGECLKGTFQCKRNTSDLRGLLINITILNKTYKYLFS